MKSKKLPKKHREDFDALEKPRKSGVKVKKGKRARKPSIYDDLEEMDEFVLNEREYSGFDDLYSDDDDDLY
ncbi:hypothetical protein [Anaerophaga thermohalophila]|jgi:hypothetical protein|uniref:hypothetical protein n=1 Tax=Anaerophaga thermohalophila TaxID=177400 RepID=UPI0002D25B34|nr:hypothetical protein [Anaerophaga thermohalophila]